MERSVIVCRWCVSGVNKMLKFVTLNGIWCRGREILIIQQEY